MKPMPTIVGMLLGLSLFAGCLGEDLSPRARSEVEAVLDVDRTEAWNGEPLRFSAANSTARTGADIQYWFDFGDGSTANSTEPNVTHTYERGGAFEALVEVADAQGHTDRDGLMVYVNERFNVTGQVFEPTIPGTGNFTSVYGRAFEVRNGSERFDLNLTLRSTLLAGSSTVRIRVIDPDNSTLVERNVTVPAGQSTAATLESSVEQFGNYTFEVRAFSGGVTFSGTLRVFYLAATEESPVPTNTTAPLRIA